MGRYAGEERGYPRRIALNLISQGYASLLDVPGEIETAVREAPEVAALPHGRKRMRK